MPSLKIEFATVRELEKKTFRVFSYGGGALLIGVVLTLAGLMFLGIPLLIVAGAVIIAGIAYVSMLGREPSRMVFCPYCANKNDVYQSRHEFNCDVCGKPVTFSESGEPVTAEPYHAPMGI